MRKVGVDGVFVYPNFKSSQNNSEIIQIPANVLSINLQFTYTHTHTHTHVYSHTHTVTHTHTHTYKRTHIYVLTHLLKLKFLYPAPQYSGKKKC